MNKLVGITGTRTSRTVAYMLTLFGFIGITILRSMVYGIKYSLNIRFGHISFEISIGGHRHIIATEQRNAASNRSMP